ncbi:MAG: site-specific DNA-methyltransferase [Methanomassiliicoccus sp.]|nr:site-specific DNA-methyltransferase [Methanomassiliicoccus sp.]
MADDPKENFLYYGDNLDILRRYIEDESVDLVYLDPPFKSQQDYNVLFAERNGEQAAAQIKAFEDTWRWDRSAAEAYESVVLLGGKVSDAMSALYKFLGPSDMMAYLAMMAPRLIELQRVIKRTGWLYLHCDPTASHYLKLLLDAVFGPENFRNEIVWRRSQPKGHAVLRFSRAHDTILSYAKTNDAIFYPQYKEHDPEYVEKFYRFIEEGSGRRYRLDNLANPNKNRPNLTYEFPPGSGIVRVWRWTEERMKKAWEDGLVVQTREGGVVSQKRYLDEMDGTLITDFWDDIEHLHGSHHEALGYPTQKPEGLLERIIQASTADDALVLDPFCGCGTTIAVAEKLHRQWIGIDITHLAISLMRHRLDDSFGDQAIYKVIGEPVSLPDAEELAQTDPYQFQWWALGLVGARPAEGKKGADKGIDGRLMFFVENGKPEQIIFSVKAGNVTVSHVRDLVGVVQREKAAIGVLISMHEPTAPMRAEAASAGSYISKELGNPRYPKIQLLTIQDLLNGRRVDSPHSVRSSERNTTFKKAPVVKKKKKEDKKQAKLM